VSLVAVVGLLAATIAGASLWLMVTEPVTVANAVNAVAAGDVAPLMRALGQVIFDALRGLFRYL
jgi:hypothetical protein